MKTRLISSLIMLASLGCAASLQADPYQFEVNASVAQFSITGLPGGKFESDDKEISLTYFLRPVNSSSGPLAERAFLSKSAFLTGKIAELKPESGPKTELLSAEARFVTQGNYIFEISYIRGDEGGFMSRTASAGLGKYLDDRAFVVVSLSQSKIFSKTSSLLARYRRLADRSASNTYLAYELGLEYFDRESEGGADGTGSGIYLDGTYYFSTQLYAKARVSYRDEPSYSSKKLEISGGYFFTDNIFGSLFGEKTSYSDEVDEDFMGLRAGLRF